MCGVIRGSIISPEINILSVWQSRQACSGECPSPTTTVQSREPILRLSPFLILFIPLGGVSENEENIGLKPLISLRISSGHPVY